MKYIRNILAFSIFLVSIVSAGANAVEGIAPNNGWDYEGQLIVITASTGSIVQACGATLQEYRAEIIKPSGMGFGFITMAFSTDSNVQTGMHFKVDAQNQCDIDPSLMILVLEQIDMMD
jgi:hypothetical protein